MSEVVVVDASAFVDILANTSRAAAVRVRLRSVEAHAPAHVDAEVLSALGRLHRTGDLAEGEVAAAIAAIARMPVTRHPLPRLLPAAWSHRQSIRVVDGLYVALAETLQAPLITTDERLARACTVAEVLL